MGLWWGGPLQMPSPGGASLQTFATHSSGQCDAALQTPERGARDGGDGDDWADSEAEEDEDFEPEKPGTGATLFV